MAVSENVRNDRLCADNIVGALDRHAGVDLNLDRSRAAVLVDHRNAALHDGAALEGADDGFCDNGSLITGGAGQGHEVVISRDVDSRRDAQVDRGQLLKGIVVGIRGGQHGGGRQGGGQQAVA